jgi:hypothetical protein
MWQLPYDKRITQMIVHGNLTLTVPTGTMSANWRITVADARVANHPVQDTMTVTENVNVCAGNVQGDGADGQPVV